jgi:hypothetical protein
MLGSLYYYHGLHRLKHYGTPTKGQGIPNDFISVCKVLGLRGSAGDPLGLSNNRFLSNDMLRSRWVPFDLDERWAAVSIVGGAFRH